MADFPLVDGDTYDSKAIVGAAHARIGPDYRPMRFSEFSGGDATVVPLLERLGFTVVGRGGRNPNWVRDELILTLDLYLRNPASPPGKGSKEIVCTGTLCIPAPKAALPG